LSVNKTLVSTKVFQRWPQDDDELWWFVWAIWGYKIPRTKVCKDHVAPFTAFANAYFARDPVAVWEASRGFGGKTMMLALLALTEALTLNCGVTILGGSGAQSQMAHRSTDSAWENDNAPKDAVSKTTLYDTILKGGGWIRSLMASQTAVRGPHPLRLLLDEIDEMDLKILEGAQGQPMRMVHHPNLDTGTVMSSTHQHPNGTMTEILKRAKENGWSIAKWCYKESSNPVDGWLTQTEINRKKTEIPKEMWKSEYDLQEPSFEGRAIDTDCVERCFRDDLLETGSVFQGYDSGICSIEEPQFAPTRYAPYVTGVDWAKEEHNTCCATFRTDKPPWKCVSWKQFTRVPWPVTVARAEAPWKRYGGKFVHDATGLGDVIDDYIHCSEIERRQHIVEGMTMNGAKRSGMFVDYIAAIENGLILYPKIMKAYEDHKFVTNEDLFTTGGHPPDSFVAGALAWAMREATRTHAAVTPEAVPRSSGSSWFGAAR
jgi:hypothetical protein